MNHSQPLVITDPAQDRYALLRLIDWWDQERIRTARIMVVGVGALGNEVLKNLALLGIGSVFIVDFDTVEASNLTRSVLFRPADGGQQKVQVAQRALYEINPETQIHTCYGDIERDVGLGLYRQMDVIIGCLDNRAARLAVNRACQRVGRPWVDGALSITDGQIRTFIPGAGACYECTLTEDDYARLNIRYSCPPGFIPMAGREPTTPMAASMVGAMQVQEAIKLVHELPVEGGVTRYFSGMTSRLGTMRYELRADCPAHNFYQPIIELENGSTHMTVQAFFAAVERLQPGPAILHLFREIVTYLNCPACHKLTSLFCPYEGLTSATLTCPKCEKRGIPQITANLTAAQVPAAVTLQQLGIPALDILPVQIGSDWQYYELAADVASILPSKKGTAHDHSS